MQISGGWFRMMDCLVIDNDAVYNHLVDKAALEKLVRDGERFHP